MKIGEKNINLTDSRVLNFKLSIILLLTLFLVFLISPLISAAEIQVKDEFDSGETLVAKVSGNFLEQPNRNNVFFYRGHVKSPVVYEIEKIGEDFYIYALLTGKTEGEYSISLENVRYMSGIEISEENIVKNFTITSNTADFSVNPGFVNALEASEFEIEMQNLQTGFITINIDTFGNFQSLDSVSLKSGEKKKISFESLDTSADVEITLSSENTNYNIPVFISSNITKEEKKEIDFRFEPDFVGVSMATGSDTKRIIYLVNNGEETVQDITFFVSEILEPYVTIFPETINDFEENSTEQIEIRLISDVEEAVIEGKIIAISENSSASVTLVLNFVKDFIPLEPEEEVIITTCEQLKGVICDATSYECSDDTVFARDGICCLAECREITETSTGKIIGWLIIIVIVLGAAWFFKKKYLGVKRKTGFFGR